MVQGVRIEANRKSKTNFPPDVHTSNDELVLLPLSVRTEIALGDKWSEFKGEF